MAPPKPKAKDKPPKLQRLPKTARIQKRPLLHPAIPSPRTNATQPKVLYISSHTPFISAVKRVRKLLALIDKRSTSNASLVNSKGSDRQRLQGVSKERRGEEVLLKATGKAIEKALGLGLFFQGQGDLKVRVRTGGVGAVDDIVEVEVGGVGVRGCGRGGGDKGGDGDVEVGDEEEEEDVPETQIRTTSMVEIGVSLR